MFGLSWANTELAIERIRNNLITVFTILFLFEQEITEETE